MVILSNDFTQNIPGEKRASQGGPAIFAQNLARHLEREGHAWKGIIPERIPSAQTAASERAHEHFWKLILPPESYDNITHAKTFRSPARLLRREIDVAKEIMSDIQPDIFFLNGFALTSWILLRAAYELGIPSVMMHAGIWVKEIQTYSDMFSPAGRRIMYQMEKDIATLATHEVFLNRFSWRAYNDCVYRVSSSRGEVIPLPIELPSVKKRRMPHSGLMRIGIVARWDRIKNHAAVLELATAARKQKLPWEFHAVTKIPKTPVNRAFKKAYMNAIQVHDPMPSDALAQFYRDMDIMILPSHFDVSPHVVPEAALQDAGTIISPHVGWVDAYRATGNRSWIADFSDTKRIIRLIDRFTGKMLTDDFLKLVRYEHEPGRVMRSYLNTFSRFTKQSDRGPVGILRPYFGMLSRFVWRH